MIFNISTIIITLGAVLVIVYTVDRYLKGI